MNERPRRFTLNILFALTMCSLFPALAYLIRSDRWEWRRITFLGSVMVVVFTFEFLRFSIKLRRKAKD